MPFLILADLTSVSNLHCVYERRILRDRQDGIGDDVGGWTNHLWQVKLEAKVQAPMGRLVCCSRYSWTWSTLLLPKSVSNLSCFGCFSYYIDSSRVSYDSVKELIHEPIYKIIRKNGYELPQDVGGGIHKLLIENQTEEEPYVSTMVSRVILEKVKLSDIWPLFVLNYFVLGNRPWLYKRRIAVHSILLLRVSVRICLWVKATMLKKGRHCISIHCSRTLLTWMSTCQNLRRLTFRTKTRTKAKTMSKMTRTGKNHAVILWALWRQLRNHAWVEEWEAKAFEFAIFAICSSPMDLDSNPDTAADLIEIPSPKATILHSPRSRKRSLSCDENADLSMERAHADEEQKKSMEPTLERMDRKADDREEEEDGDEEMEMGEALSRRDVSPIRARSPKKLDSPPPSIPSKRWSPSRRRSPPPPQTRYSRGGSPPPPGSSSRYWSPPPPSLRRNRSPPPPSHYYQPPPYERSGSTASSSSGYQGFRSPPPFPQRSKDPRDRSSSTYVFHSGSAPKYRDRFINAPADPRLSTNRSASSSVVPQKRPYDDPSGSMEDDKGTVLSDAVDLPASVFPLADDDDDGMGDHFIPPPQPVNPSVAGASSSSSSPSAPGGPSSSSSTAPPVDPPPQITSITLVPAGMSKSRRKKMRKEALAKPLDF